MWIKSENSETTKPTAVEMAGNHVILRKAFRRIAVTEEIPEHWEYLERQLTKEQYDVYQELNGIVQEQADALVELAELISEVM